jgi:shikimate kinase
MKNIVILGFMGTGKSSVAKIVAKKLNFQFIEMDNLIEEKEGITINKIFQDKGEEYFRTLERKLTQEISPKQDQVISTGGGIVLNEKNILDFRKNGILFSLLAKPEVILERVKKETHRPLLKTKDPLKTIKKMLNYRKPFYKKADYQIDTSDLTIKEVSEEIIKIVNQLAG